LPKFAKQLEITYGIENLERVENMTSAQGRLSNAWTEFVRSLDASDNKLSQFFTKTISTLGTLVQGVTLIFESEEKKRERVLDTLRKNAYNQTIGYYNSLEKIKKEDLENDKAYNLGKVKEATDEFNRLKSRNLILKALRRETIFGTIETRANEAERIANEQKMRDINSLISRYKGQVQAVNSLLTPQIKHVDLTKKSGDEDKKGAKNKREKIEALKSEIKTLGTTIEQIDKYIDYLRTEMILNAGNTEETEKLTKALKEAQDARKAMFGVPEAGNGIVNNIDKTTEAVKELSEESKRYLNSFIDDFASNSGFSETFKLLKGEIEEFGESFAVTFNAIAEVAQETFNFISNASQQNFDAEKERLQSQYDVAFKFANGNKEAEEKLADDLEKKKKEIANREAKAKKEQALFNIAIDTAQAAVAALPNFVLAGIILALGAVQLAMVSSQKIPQYFKGGTHGGGLMMVNDAPGSNFKETIVYPGGSIAKPEGRNVLMNAPAGTKIYTPDQWDKIEQEKQLFNMLQPRGISMGNYQYNQQPSITKADMRDAMLEAIGEQPQTHFSFDEDGITQRFINKGNVNIKLSKRGNSSKTRFS
jgi:hypothetical protein